MRAPLRVALGGGGTDLASYYREHGGLVVSTAIDKYVHMTVSARFQSRFVLKHLEWEEVDDPSEVRHPILRAALTHHWDGGPIELASVGDAPPGTGLGSSGAYTVCAIKALAALSGRELEPAQLAEAACHLEIERGRPLDRQAGPVRAPPSAACARTRSSPTAASRCASCGCPTAMRAALRDQLPALLHRPAALGLGDPRRRAGRGRAAPAQGAGRRDLRGARGRRPRAARRADARALGGQAPARARHGHDRDGRAARPRAGRRRARGDLAGRGRRRLPARLLARPGAHARGAGRAA